MMAGGCNGQRGEGDQAPAEPLPATAGRQPGAPIGGAEQSRQRGGSKSRRLLLGQRGRNSRRRAAHLHRHFCGHGHVGKGGHLVRRKDLHRVAPKVLDAEAARAAQHLRRVVGGAAAAAVGAAPHCWRCRLRQLGCGTPSAAVRRSRRHGRGAAPGERAGAANIAQTSPCGALPGAHLQAAQRQLPLLLQGDGVAPARQPAACRMRRCSAWHVGGRPVMGAQARGAGSWAALLVPLTAQTARSASAPSWWRAPAVAEGGGR